MKLEYHDIGWRYWLATAILLTLGVLGWVSGFYLAIGVTIVHLIHFLFLEGNIKSLPVQVRASLLLILICFLWGPIRFLYWLPVIGLWARVLFSYCFLARTLSLFSWNRKQPLNAELVKRVYFSPPVSGSILDLQN